MLVLNLASQRWHILHWETKVEREQSFYLLSLQEHRRHYQGPLLYHQVKEADHQSGHLLVMIARLLYQWQYQHSKGYLLSTNKAREQPCYVEH